MADEGLPGQLVSAPDLRVAEGIAAPAESKTKVSPRAKNTGKAEFGVRVLWSI